MITISVKYTMVWRLNFAPEYGWTKDGKCFNMKRAKQLKQSMQGGSIGYYIRSKFYTLKYLRQHLIKIKSTNNPF